MRSVGEDIGISGVDDGHGGAAVVLPAGSAQGGVVAGVEHHAGLGQHGVVLDLGLADGGAVVGEQDEAGLAVAEGAQGALVAEHVLAALDHQAQLAVDVVGSSLLHHWLILIKIINIRTHPTNSPQYGSPTSFVSLFLLPSCIGQQFPIVGTLVH